MKRWKSINSNRRTVNFDDLRSRGNFYFLLRLSAEWVDSFKLQFIVKWSNFWFEQHKYSLVCIVRAFDRSEVYTISCAESCIYIYSLGNVNLNNLENGQLSQMKDKEMPLSFVYDFLMQSHSSISADILKFIEWKHAHNSTVNWTLIIHFGLHWNRIAR